MIMFGIVVNMHALRCEEGVFKVKKTRYDGLPRPGLLTSSGLDVAVPSPYRFAEKISFLRNVRRQNVGERVRVRGLDETIVSLWRCHAWAPSPQPSPPKPRRQSVLRMVRRNTSRFRGRGGKDVKSPGLPRPSKRPEKHTSTALEGHRTNV